jgi:hypothetical protein
MDGSTRDGATQDRPFDPGRVAVAPAAQQLVLIARERIRQVERRDRRRRPDEQRRHDTSVEALICDLAHRALSERGGCIAVPLAKSALSLKQRPADFMTENFAADVRACESGGIGALTVGRRGEGEIEARRSTLRPTDWLLGQLGQLGVTLRDFSSNKDRTTDPIEVRSEKIAGAKGKRIALPDSPIVDALRAEMNEVNEWLRHAELDCSEPTADVNDRFLIRKFNNSSLEHGGRLYGGFWEGLPSAQRIAALTIEGHAVASVDFGQLGIAIAYGIAKATPPDGDHYVIPALGGKEARAGVKTVLIALLSKDGPMARFPPHTRKLFPSLHNRKFDSVLRLIQWHHEPIAHLFGTGLALTTQNIDSRVLLRTLLQLKSEGVVALPLHDCVFVRADLAERAKAVMEEAFERVVPGGRVTANIDYG